MSLRRFQLPDGTEAIWHRRLTEVEWERIAAKRPKGPARTLSEFWEIVMEDLADDYEDGEYFHVSEVVLHPEDDDHLIALVGNRRDLRWQKDAAFVLMDGAPRRGGRWSGHPGSPGESS